MTITMRLGPPIEHPMSMSNEGLNLFYYIYQLPLSLKSFINVDQKSVGEVARDYKVRGLGLYSNNNRMAM